MVPLSPDASIVSVPAAAFADVIAARSVFAPLSARLLTTKVAGTTRSSIDSSRHNKAAGLRCAGRFERCVLVHQRLDAVTVYSPIEEVDVNEIGRTEADRDDG
jgi:hypothetical protein